MPREWRAGGEVMTHIPLFEMLRGQIVESVHFGSLAVADAEGRLLAWAGDPHTITYMRSSAKPLQALPLVLSGAAKGLGLNRQELAIVCASHSGTDEHVMAVASIQKKAGFGEGDLQCGAAFPSDEASRQRMQSEALPPTENRHNCSGKHSGMLALARYLGAPLGDYLRLDHPVQRQILGAISRLSGLTETEIAIGVDGCSAPNFALPLLSAARAYACLVDSTGMEPDLAAACGEVVGAMIQYPECVAGPGGFDTELMAHAGGGLVSKGGAEGYQALGIRSGGSGSRGGLGVAIKIADGDPRRRAAPAIALSVLERLGVLQAGALEALSQFADPPVLNDRQAVVGGGRLAYELQFEGDRGWVPS
jgi:L-asparaginase II